MALRDIALKQEYRSDRDDIVHEFFIRCLSNSTSYDRSIAQVSVKSLITLAFGSVSTTDMKLRIVSGNHYRASDIALLGKMFSTDPGTYDDSRLAEIASMIRDSRIQIKIAIPNADEVAGAFTERVGIFTDTAGDMVAFTGTSNQTFDSQNRDFESIDVFTSWDDASRVETKVSDFENLWKDETRYLSVCDFAYAESENLLKYSSSWAVELE